MATEGLEAQEDKKLERNGYISTRLKVVAALVLTLAFLLIGAACDNEESSKSTNDSAATVDEVIGTTVVETTIMPTTVKPTEKATEQPRETVLDEQPESEDIDEEVQIQENEEYLEDSESDINNKKKDSANEEYLNYGYSEYEIDLIARTTYLESGSCGEYCQWLTASTILNLAESRGGIANVVYDYNTFNVAGMIDSCSPSDLSYSVARRVASGDRDYNVMAFRAGYYHSFGTPYTSVDNVYFSTY